MATEGTASSLLLKRNREIAQIRDDLVKCVAQLEEVQKKNKILLEESATVDSEVFQHSSRAALAEERLAELLDAEIRLNGLRSEHDAAHTSKVDALQRQCEDQQLILRETTQEAELETRRAMELEPELTRLRTLVSEEQAEAERARQACQDPDRFQVAEARAQQEAARALEQTLDALNVEKQVHGGEIATTRHRIETLAAERDTLIQNRDGLARMHKLHQSRMGSNDDPHAQLEKLQEILIARGADPVAILAAGGASSDDAEMAKKGAELSKELASAEEQLTALQKQHQRTQKEDAKTVELLNSKLDSARNELQDSLRQAAEAHGAGVARLESEIQEERQLELDEMAAQQAARLKMDQHREVKAAALERQGAAMMNLTMQASRCTELSNELRKVQDANSATEVRVNASRTHLRDLENRRRATTENGKERVGQVRDNLQQLWKELQKQAERIKSKAEAEEAPSSDASPRYEFAPPDR